MTTVIEGDLLEQDVDAIVNAWNRNFIHFSKFVQHGVAGAIRAKAGDQPFVEIGTQPIEIGETRVTGAGELPHRAIIHVPGIEHDWTTNADIIRRGASGAVKAAMEHGFKSIAMPLLGSGVGGFDEDESLRVTMEGIADANPPKDLEIRIVRWKRRA